MARSTSAGASSTPRKPAASVAKKSPAKKAAAKRAPARKKAPAKKAAAAKKAPAKRAPARKAAAKKATQVKPASKGARGGGDTSATTTGMLGLVTTAVAELIESLELGDDHHRLALAASALSIASVIDRQVAVLATAAVHRELRETIGELVGDDGSDSDDELDAQDRDWSTPA